MAIHPDDDNAPDEADESGRWVRTIERLFEWANELYVNPTPPMIREDAVYMSGLMLALAGTAKHGESGRQGASGAIGVLRFSVLSMAHYRPEEMDSPEANAVFDDLGRWLEEIYPTDNPKYPKRAAAVRAEWGRVLPTILGDRLWLGKLLRGYSAAARRNNRGGLKSIAQQAWRAGMIDPKLGDLTDQLLLLLEARRHGLDAPMSRMAGGVLLPSFGDALDELRREMRGDSAVPLELADAEADVIDAVDQDQQLREHRERLRLQGLIESFPRRRGRSAYARAVADNAWRLCCDNDPSALADELGVAARPMRREWQRHLERMRNDPKLGPTVRAMYPGPGA